jgi:hypothetical protein
MSVRYVVVYVVYTLVGAAMTAVAAKAVMMDKNFIIKELSVG